MNTDRILAEGKADFVAFGRPLMADPHMPNKAKEGRSKEIQQCIYCGNCMAYLYDSVPGDRSRFFGLACTVNPNLFREEEFIIKPAKAPKSIMVGDHPIDVTSAQVVGMMSVGVLTGKAGPDDLINAGASFVLDRASDMIEHLTN